MLKRHVYSTSDALFDFIASELERYSEKPKPQHISLLGGSTAKALFKYITTSEYKSRINWRNLHFWWGDERCVGITSTESNFGEARRQLFDRIVIPEHNLHPVISPAVSADDVSDNSLSAEQCQLALEQFIADLKHMLEENSPIHDALAYPKFDWVLLGVGDDGHTASLFPADFDQQEPACAILVNKPGTHERRISLSAQCISSAKRVSYLATGKSKAKVLAEIFEHASAARDYPAALIRSNCGETDYYLDVDAAELLIKC